VAIRGDRIVEVGQLAGAPAVRTIDAVGRAVTPGVVDMHSHADFTLPILPTADSLVHQGITTAVIGQCGATPAPLLPETRAQSVAMLEGADYPLPWEEWTTLGSYLDYLSGIGLSANVVSLVGQGTVRAAVMGFTADPPDQAQMRRMQAEVDLAMDQGAIGVSSGLIYPPGSYASTEELIAVTRPAGRRGGFYFSHIRGEGETLLDAVAEALRIGLETGAAVQISHFKASGRENWPKSVAALALIAEAQAAGLDATADMYPYLAGSTGLSATLPQWAHQGGKEALLERLADRATRVRMAAEIESLSGEWETVFISGFPANRAYEGHHVAELAAEAGKSPSAWIMDALLEAELDAEMVTFGMSEENRRQELQAPWMMIGTDGVALATEGPMARGKPHPRNFGTFPRVLAHYVRAEGVLSLEEAVHRMCGLPAHKLRWSDRGLIRPGYQADLVILDPDTVADRATYENPHQYPSGIHHVLVNGRLVIDEGRHTLVRPGRVLGRVS
jgi:N-acyl-D-amino-acid deacylase